MSSYREESPLLNALYIDQELRQDSVLLSVIVAQFSKSGISGC